MTQKTHSSLVKLRRAWRIKNIRNVITILLLNVQKKVGMSSEGNAVEFNLLSRLSESAERLKVC